MSAAAVAPTRSVGRGGKSDFLHHPITRNVLPFLNGGAAGMIATSFIQPVDMVKVCAIAFSLSFPLGLSSLWWERESGRFGLDIPGPVRVEPYFSRCLP